MPSLTSLDFDSPDLNKADLLSALRAFVDLDIEEGGTIDYKRDLGKGEWLKTVAAFANSLGGFILLGVTNDSPRKLVGLERTRDDLKTRLASLIVGRIQAVPDFSIGVTNLPDNRLAAVIRVRVGTSPPYVYKPQGADPRVLIRVADRCLAAARPEFDYLFEKRMRATAGTGDAEAALSEWQVFGPEVPLRAQDSTGTYADVPGGAYSFVSAPHGLEASQVLDVETEERFDAAVRRVFCYEELNARGAKEVCRHDEARTLFRATNDQTNADRCWALGARGEVAFASGLSLDNDPDTAVFRLVLFARDLVSHLKLTQTICRDITDRSDLVIQAQLRNWANSLYFNTGWPNADVPREAHQCFKGLPSTYEYKFSGVVTARTRIREIQLLDEERQIQEVRRLTFGLVRSLGLGVESRALSATIRFAMRLPPKEPPRTVTG